MYNVCIVLSHTHTHCTHTDTHIHTVYTHEERTLHDTHNSELILIAKLGNFVKINMKTWNQSDYYS